MIDELADQHRPDAVWLRIAAVDPEHKLGLSLRRLTLRHVALASECVRPQKGEKTDFRDAIDLGHHHRHGLLTGSYLPERGIVELRDLTRRRKKLLGHFNSEKNRIQKVLEMANVKMGNVMKDVFGVSGQQILEALLTGRELADDEIAGMTHQRLRTKIPELVETLRDHHMTDHHRWLIQQSIDHMVFLDRQLEALEDKIQEKLEPYRRQFELLRTIPGMGDTSAAAILAEIGPDMRFFETADSICNWAGICPGNNRSAGKSKSSHVKKANRYLFTALVQAGWGAIRKRDCTFCRKFHRWVGKLGKKKANVAIGHSLLRVAYAILRDGKPYQEPDANHLHALERRKRVHHHVRRLQKLGADPEELQQIVERLLTPVEAETDAPIDGTAEQEPAPEELGEARVLPKVARPAQRGRRRAAPITCRSAAIRRGALGIRARVVRNNIQFSNNSRVANLRRRTRNPRPRGRGRNNPNLGSHDAPRPAFQAPGFVTLRGSIFEARNSATPSWKLLRRRSCKRSWTAKRPRAVFRWSITFDGT